MFPVIRRSRLFLTVTALFAIAAATTPMVSAGSPVSFFSANVQVHNADQDVNAAAVKLVWTTGNEISIAGFNLYRGLSLDEPFVKINPLLIPAFQDTIAGGNYVYVDKSANSYAARYYRLEVVSLNGVSTQYGPVLASQMERPTPLEELVALVHSILPF